MLIAALNDDSIVIAHASSKTYPDQMSWKDQGTAVMSFKREGNDSNLLSKLRKRRINELLGEQIPKDEAKLLSNGRFTCTVCNCIPIFDTVSMLIIHRQGKKHLANQEIHESQKVELKHLVAVRKHQQFLKDGTTSVHVACSSRGGILLSTPYDSRVKKSKLGPTERKPRLDFQSKFLEQPKSSPDDTTYSSFMHDVDRVGISATSNFDLPGNSMPSSSHWQDIANQQLSGPVMHVHHLKEVFTSKKCSEEHSKVFPYQRKRKQVGGQVSATFRWTQNGATCDQHKSLPFCPPQLPKSPSSSVLGREKQRTAENTPKKGQGSFTEIVPNALPPPPPPPPPMQPASLTQSPPKHQEKSSADVLLSQKLRQLQGSGWKRDWDGKWIKDEDAEFDSDEEAPDIP
ncbi:sodium channel modifier 1 [Plakobranchus ocellatus]|uniref:Sodium channel modifier 1 n=1 Tax=Plakobranchus ocellatus TaxID=259542 RepID=A0AAV4A318_9GAST|nr:sodium channel modifier 1 [Plakobranchus ocellatus]